MYVYYVVYAVLACVCIGYCTYTLFKKGTTTSTAKSQKKKHQHTAKAIFQPKKLGPFVLEQPAGIIVFILAW